VPGILSAPASSENRTPIGPNPLKAPSGIPSAFRSIARPNRLWRRRAPWLWWPGASACFPAEFSAGAAICRSSFCVGVTNADVKKDARARYGVLSWGVLVRRFFADIRRAPAGTQGGAAPAARRPWLIPPASLRCWDYGVFGQSKPESLAAPQRLPQRQPLPLRFRVSALARGDGVSPSAVAGVGRTTGGGGGGGGGPGGGGAGPGGGGGGPGAPDALGIVSRARLHRSLARMTALSGCTADPPKRVVVFVRMRS